MEEELSMTDSEGMRDKLARSSEDALGKLAQDLLENPLVSGALTRAFGARERAVQAQEAAMGALNLPSAADLERLTRRLRSVSQRLEGIEDAVDPPDGRMERLTQAAPKAADEQLAAVEAQLARLTAEVTQLARAVGEGPSPVPREQERLEVGTAEAPAPKKRASTRKGGSRTRAASS